jgi:hypothetical protein
MKVSVQTPYATIVSDEIDDTTEEGICNLIEKALNNPTTGYLQLIIEGEYVYIPKALLVQSIVTIEE